MVAGRCFRHVGQNARVNQHHSLCFGEEGSLRMCCCTDPLAVHTVPQKHQKSGVGDVASEQLVVDCFGTSCPGAEE